MDYPLLKSLLFDFLQPLCKPHIQIHMHKSFNLEKKIKRAVQKLNLTSGIGSTPNSGLNNHTTVILYHFPVPLKGLSHGK